MRHERTISPQVVVNIKAKIKSGLSLQAVGRIMGISYYTVWCVSKGKYDSHEPLQPPSKEKKTEYFIETERENWLL